MVIWPQVAETATAQLLVILIALVIEAPNQPTHLLGCTASLISAEPLVNCLNYLIKSGLLLVEI